MLIKNLIEVIPQFLGQRPKNSKMINNQTYSFITTLI